MAAKGRITLFFVIILQAAVAINAGKSKYAKEVNMPKDAPNMKTPFRMQKVNFVWQKAMKRLSPVEQEELYVDLKIHDKLELDLKWTKAEGGDEDGEQEAEVRDKLREILLRYGLQDHFGDKEENETFEKRKLGDIKDSHMLKMDKKVAKLWKKAQMSGFSDEELAQLKREFLHHTQKMDEYKQLKNEIDAFDGISDNSLNGLKKAEYDLRDRKLMDSDLKTKYREMKADYERLERLSRAPSQDYEFTEPSVIDLWILAKKANFSTEELDSLKVELAHFEHKIKKHNHYQDQVRLSKESFKARGKTNDLPIKHDDLEQKANDYGVKVRKTHREIKKRISKALGVHNEL